MSDKLGEMQWTKNWLESHGFEGWITGSSLTRSDVPQEPGVYMVVGDTERPSFLTHSVGGPHKGAALTVNVESLNAAWTGSEVLYIGKSDGPGGLRKRVWAYAQQGRGNDAGHAGGRYLWQHPASPDLRVGWRTTGEHDPGDIKEALLTLFVEEFDQRPFANLRGGYRITPPQAREHLKGWL